MNRSSPGWRRRQLALVAALVFTVALVVRLLFLGAAIDRPWPHSAYYEGDAILWAQGAESLERGMAPDDPLFFRSNALAHLLHALRGLDHAVPDAGRDYTRIKILWCVASALTCAVLYLFCAASFPIHGGATALWAAGLSIFSFGAYVIATSLNTEAPYALVLVLLLGASWRFTRRPTLPGALALGGLNGLAIWFRIEHLLLLALLSLYFIARWRASAAAPDDRRGVRFWARRAGLLLVVAVTAGLVCLPSSIESTRAARHYNTVARRAPAYDQLPPGAQAPLRWTPDARAFVESLPAFARHRAVELLSPLGAQRGLPAMTASSARQLWLDQFGYLPEPLATPVFVSGQGPLNFALANHPRARGAFSKAALAGDDARLTLSLPSHLRLYNHGYAVGWGYVRADPLTWLAAVGRKLLFFYQGASSGLGAYNLPLGRFGERRPCDLLTPFPVRGLPWQVAFGALVIAGAVLASRREAGQLCLLVIAYKLIVTVAFFGYARQAVSILPAILVLVALALDALAVRVAARARLGLGVRGGLIAAAAVTALCVALELHAAAHPPAFDIKGPLRAAPEWGEGAFSSNADVFLYPQK